MGCVWFSIQGVLLRKHGKAQWREAQHAYAKQKKENKENVKKPKRSR